MSSFLESIDLEDSILEDSAEVKKRFKPNKNLV